MKKIRAGFEILTPISEGGIKELQHIEKLDEYVISQKIVLQKMVNLQRNLLVCLLEMVTKQ